MDRYQERDEHRAADGASVREEEAERTDPIEQVLKATLERGGRGAVDAEERARDRIAAPYEYRIKAEKDPIAEETKIIRSMATEPDDKYDAYVREAGDEGK